MPVINYTADVSAAAGLLSIRIYSSAPCTPEATRALSQVTYDVAGTLAQTIMSSTDAMLDGFVVEHTIGREGRITASYPKGGRTLDAIALELGIEVCSTEGLDPA
jgi:hypothetical protein